ncbi:MAG: hypothetical protein FIA92_01945 [Chloroflexi bacterium]|nr:hypothetical protein [Chloroflexota bacterium]
MAEMVLRCTRCGYVDQARAFESADDAASEMQHWACSRCAWSDWELVPKGESETIELGAPER